MIWVWSGWLAGNARHTPYYKKQINVGLLYIYTYIWIKFVISLFPSSSFKHALYHFFTAARKRRIKSNPPRDDQAGMCQAGIKQGFWICLLSSELARKPHFEPKWLRRWQRLGAGRSPERKATCYLLSYKFSFFHSRNYLIKRLVKLLTEAHCSDFSLTIFAC